MNLILLEPGDFLDATTARLTGRRLRHIREVHRAETGRTLRAGVLGGSMGLAEVIESARDHITLRVELTEPPPPPGPLSIVLALPRPKVLSRVLASLTALGVKSIDLINAWRVDKSYWNSPRLDEGIVREAVILGLEQGCDTVPPRIEMHRLFMPFVETHAPRLAAGATALVAHPGSGTPCPAGVQGPVVLAIGPEGGFIAAEVASFERAGFVPVHLGDRILPVETAVSFLVGRVS